MATNKDRAQALTFRNRTTSVLVSDSCYHGEEKGTRQHPAAGFHTYILTKAEHVCTEG